MILHGFGKDIEKKFIAQILGGLKKDGFVELDSMHQLNIAFEIEFEFGISLEPEKMSMLKSVKEICKLLEVKRL